VSSASQEAGERKAFAFGKGNKIVEIDLIDRGFPFFAIFPLFFRIPKRRVKWNAETKPHFSKEMGLFL
jgi:hypothetical protein